MNRGDDGEHDARAGYPEEILVSFVGVSIGDFLDRLLMETDQGNRKALLALAFRFDAEAIPATCRS
jgi:hypothetical protein